MQASEPISNPEQTNNSSVTKVLASQKPVAKKPITSWLLVSLVILLLGTTSIFSYKYYQLKQQVLQKQPISLPEPTKTPEIPSLAPTVDPTVNWKTYINEEYGFKLKYPSTWINDREEENTKVFKFLTQFSPTKPVSIYNFIIMITQKGYEKIYEETVNVVNRDSNCGEKRNIVIGKDNIQATKFNYFSGGFVEIILFRDKDRTFLVEIGYPNKLGDSLEAPKECADPQEYKQYQEFKEILSTFQFIN